MAAAQKSPRLKHRKSHGGIMLGNEGSLKEQVLLDLSLSWILVLRRYALCLALALFGAHAAAGQQSAQANPPVRVCVGLIRPSTVADRTAIRPDNAFSGSVSISDLLVSLSKTSDKSPVRLIGVPVELERSKAGYPIPERYKECDYLIEIGNEEFRDRCTDVADATVSCEERQNTAAAYGHDVHLVGQQRVEFWVYRAGAPDSLLHKKATVILHWGTTSERKLQGSPDLMDEVARQVRDKIQRDVSIRGWPNETKSPNAKFAASN
jgi:hypothetical protein